MKNYYRKREAFDSGGGSGLIVTNAFFEHTAKHSPEFNFNHDNYNNFKGTSLSWNDVRVVVSDNYIDYKILNEYTNEQCFELILDNISAEAMIDCIQRISDTKARKAVFEFKETVRRLFQ